MFSMIDEDADEKDDSKRKTRNMSEKKRRDQFNSLVNELSAMVTATSRKMDKSTVLRSAISFLKNYNEVSVRSKMHDIDEDWKPAFLSNEEFMHLILEAFDGFIVVFSSSGRILYTSGNITSLLGYLPTDVLNMSIYELMLEEDHADLYNLLLNPPTVIDPVQESLSADNQVCFRCHLKREGQNYQDVVAYENVQFTGYFRTAVKYEQTDDIDEELFKSINPVDSKYIFVGTTRIQNPKLIRDLSINGTKKSEFTSRHSLEWKFLYLDHRAPPIIGYLPIEVLGTSGYDYYHFDDLEQVAQCHEALKLKGEGTSCYYRFLTKGQQWLWLQTRYYITYHQWTSRPEFIVCTHRVISFEDVVQQMRRNNGRVEDGEDVDNSADSVERQLNASASSMNITSPWSSHSSRSRVEGRPSTPSVSNFRHRYNTYHGSIADDMIYNDMATTHHHPIEPDSNLPMKSSPASSIHTSTAALPSPTSEMSQFVATYSIPVEPLIKVTYPSSVVLTSSHLDAFDDTPIITVTSHTMLQDQLQRKHEELQLMIGHQQNELRRVSEQLAIARCGIPIVSVALPFCDVDAMPRAASSIADSNRYSPDRNSDRLSASNECLQSMHQQQSHHQQHQHQHHHRHHQRQQHQQQQHQQQQQQHQEQRDQQHHHLQQPSTDGESADEVRSYMQLQPVTTSLHHQYTHHVLQQHRDDGLDALNPTMVKAQQQQNNAMLDDADGDG